MDRHKSYKVAKRLIEIGDTKQFRDIFEHIPRTVAARDLGIHYDKFKRLIEDVEGFTLLELYTLAGFIGIDGKIILGLADAQHEANKKKRKK